MKFYYNCFSKLKTITKIIIYRTIFILSDLANNKYLFSESVKTRTFVDK